MPAAGLGSPPAGLLHNFLGYFKPWGRSSHVWEGQAELWYASKNGKTALDKSPPPLSPRLGSEIGEGRGEHQNNTPSLRGDPWFGCADTRGAVLGGGGLLL